MTITVDDILRAHTAIYDLDDLLSHFDVRSQFSTELGRALARVYDRNVFRQIALAARAAAAGPSFPTGVRIVRSTLAPTSGVFDGAAWIQAIRDARAAMFQNDVPDTETLFMAVPRGLFDAIKYARDSNGRYIVQDREINLGENAGGVTGRGQRLMIENVVIMPTRNLPNTNETSDTSVFAKYRANYSTTQALMWHPMAVATVKLRDITLETERTVRRLENFMVAHMLVGHGTLRQECAVEFASA